MVRSSLEEATGAPQAGSRSNFQGHTHGFVSQWAARKKKQRAWMTTDARTTCALALQLRNPSACLSWLVLAAPKVNFAIHSCQGMRTASKGLCTRLF
jgi:hypothetical protein